MNKFFNAISKVIGYISSRYISKTKTKTSICPRWTCCCGDHDDNEDNEDNEDHEAVIAFIRQLYREAVNEQFGGGERRSSGTTSRCGANPSRHKNVSVDPAVLRAYGIPVRRVVQEIGDMIVLPCAVQSHWRVRSRREATTKACARRSATTGRDSWTRRTISLLNNSN